MANFAPLFITAAGKHERLTTADGGLEINVIDCVAANSAVSLFPTVNNTGTVAILAAFNGTANLGAVGGTFAAQGSLTVATNFTVTGISIFNGNTTIGSDAADDVIVNAKVNSSLTFKTGAPRIIGVDAAALTVQTTTSGTLTVAGAAAVAVNSGTTMALTPTTTFAVSGGTTIGLTAGAASDLTLGARAGTVTLNQAGNTVLSGFTATSIVGALNELRASVGDVIPTYIAGEAITAGNLVCLELNGGVAKVYKCDNTNAALNRPVGIALAGALLGANCNIVTAGEATISSAIAATNEGEYVFMTTAGAMALAAPGTGTVMVVGVVSVCGGGAGTCKIIYQPLLPTTL